MSEKPWTGIAGKMRSGSPAGHLNDEFLGLIQSWIDEAVSAAMPEMGTVIGQDGGTVRVRLDSEDVDREVGFPAAKGTAYQPNDRVWTHQTKGGSKAVLGRVDGSQDQRAVDSPQLYGNAVKHEHIDGSAVETTNIKDLAVTNGKLDTDVQKSLGKADSALQSIPGEYVTKSEADKDYLTSKDLPDLSKYEKGTDHKADIDKINKRLDKLEKSKDKKS